MLDSMTSGSHVDSPRMRHAIYSRSGWVSVNTKLHESTRVRHLYMCREHTEQHVVN